MTGHNSQQVELFARGVDLSQKDSAAPKEETMPGPTRRMGQETFSLFSYALLHHAMRDITAQAPCVRVCLLCRRPKFFGKTPFLLH